MANKCPKCNSYNTTDSKFCKECGTQLFPSQEVPEVTKTLETPAQELARGTVFADRYEIIEELGKGGMGEVYRVYDKKIEGELALKLIKPEVAADKKTIERFRNELKLAREIAHRNVCRMYDLNEEKGSYYITMEYVSGEDLKSLIRRMGRIPTEKAISITKQVSEGLSEAHSLGIIHRDLKPSNIMIDKEGNARIMDFGIARSIEAKGITDRGVMIGTPEYLSPELAETKEVDHRSDIYSLAVILYEMVTGQRPFEGETALSVARKHADEIPRYPKEINPQIPDDLNGVIMKCLEKDKEKRYQSAGEVRSELENIEKGIPSTDREIPRRKPLTSKEITVTFGLKKLLVPALIFIAVVVIGLVIWQLLPEKESIPSEPIKPSVAVLPFHDLSPEKDQEYFCDGLAESIINALTKVKDLRVPARASSFSFKGKERNMQEIGARLNVNTILEGSVQKAGNRVRITAQLINVSDESHLWSEQYDRDLDDIFSIQDDITLSVIDNLKIELLGDTRERVVKRYTDNKEAYDLYLRGHWLYSNQFSEEDWRRSISYYESAIEIDPEFSLAYVGLAVIYTKLCTWHFISPDDALPKIKEALRQSLKIDNMLAEAVAWSGFIKLRFEWDWSGINDIKKAVELNPNSYLIRSIFAKSLLYSGQVDEAIQEFSRALEVDPLISIGQAEYGGLLYIARRYDDAIAQSELAIELSPDYAIAHKTVGFCNLRKSLYQEAISAIKKAVTLSRNSTEFLSDLAYGYALSGNNEKALEILEDLERLSEHKYVSYYKRAYAYSALGEKDRAFEYLELAYKDRDPDLIMLKIDPELDPLHADPRFVEMLKKMNF